MSRTALILGASGKFSRHAAVALAAKGWTIRNFDRKADTPESAAKGVQLIVNGMNPPNYENWEVNIPAITDIALRAARASGARIVVPGNVYNFGSAGDWGPQSAQDATTTKGRVRIAMEAQYRQAARDGIRTIILRAGDFIDPDGNGTWMDQAVTKSLSAGKVIYPGATDIPHAWAYLPDLGRAVAALAEIDARLPDFADIPFAGFTVTGTEMKQALEDVTGRALRFGRFPWWIMTLAAPVWPLARELREMRYLWDMPHGLDGTSFDAVLPEFEPTSLEEALRAVIKAPQGQTRGAVNSVALA